MCTKEHFESFIDMERIRFPKMQRRLLILWLFKRQLNDISQHFQVGRLECFIWNWKFFSKFWIGKWCKCHKVGYLVNSYSRALLMIRLNPIYTLKAEASIRHMQKSASTKIHNIWFQIKSDSAERLDKILQQDCLSFLTHGSFHKMISGRIKSGTKTKPRY